MNMDWDENLINDEIIEEPAEEPYWSPRRIIYTVFILLTLIAFLLYIYGWILCPPVRIPPLPPAAFSTV
ncbi:MAG: hypothetical protein K8I60_02930 [Anaerolineae bacterium]|nr:hypothetical protein [Anaerolineae bacterium]